MKTNYKSCLFAFIVSEDVKINIKNSNRNEKKSSQLDLVDWLNNNSQINIQTVLRRELKMSSNGVGVSSRKITLDAADDAFIFYYKLSKRIQNIWNFLTLTLS